MGNGGAIRVGTPHEVATEVSRQHGVRRRARRPRRLRPRRSGARARSSPWSTRPTCWSTPARCGRGSSHAVAPEFPDVDRRLPARRRGDDLPDDRPGALRRDRHRQPLRRHHHRPRRRDHRRHRPGGLGQHQPRRHRPLACSSRCTARRPTSPASRRPTPPPRSSPSSLLLDHLGYADGRRRRRGRRRSPTWPTSPPGRRAAVHLRGRRRDRRPRSRLGPAGYPVDRVSRTFGPLQRPQRGRTAHSVGRPTIDPAPEQIGGVSMDISTTRTPSPSTTRGSPRSSRTPASARTSPTTCSRSSGRRRRLARRAGSRRTARSRSTRRPPSCTTRRRSSRA